METTGDMFELQIQVTIMKRSAAGGYSNERLSVAENMLVPARSFAEVCAVLGRFHEELGAELDAFAAHEGAVEEAAKGRER